jgi:hypothetical protein
MSDKFRELFIIYLCRAHYGVVQQVDKLMRKLWGVSYENGVSYLEKKNYTDDDLSKEIKGPRKLIWTVNENLISNRTVLEKVYKSLNKQSANLTFKYHMGIAVGGDIEIFQDPKMQEILSRLDTTQEQRHEFEILRNKVITTYSAEQKRLFKVHIYRYQIPPNYDMAQLLWDMKRACMMSEQTAEQAEAQSQTPTVDKYSRPSILQELVADFTVQLPPRDHKHKPPQDEPEPPNNKPHQRANADS